MAQAQARKPTEAQHGDGSDWMSLGDAAIVLDEHRATVLKRAAHDEIDVMRVAGYTFVRRVDVERVKTEKAAAAAAAGTK